MLIMLKKINQGENIAVLHRVFDQCAFLHAQPYGQAPGLQPQTELTNRKPMQ